MRNQLCKTVFQENQILLKLLLAKGLVVDLCAVRHIFPFVLLQANNTLLALDG